MYAYLNGKLAEKTADIVVIECAGIGFELKIPLSTFEQLPAEGEMAKLYTYTYTNDEGTRLFGFFTRQEKELFRLLININKIGPKLALALMSYISVKELLTAIISNNATIIAKTPGFGKKTAERLIIELKDKIETISALDAKDFISSETNSADTGFINQMWVELDAGLTSLGYKSFEIRKALQNVKITDKMTTQEALKACIQYIYMKRNDL